MSGSRIAQQGDRIPELVCSLGFQYPTDGQEFLHRSPVVALMTCGLLWYDFES